jgi:N-acetyl-anhydromuramoyl-L-alanine amidase
MDAADREQRRAIDPESGLLTGARQLGSPHQDDRPDGVTPELIIIHGISLPSGEFGGPWIERLFMGDLDRSQHPTFAQIPALEVSAHLLIRRDGEIIQFVPFHRRAWHAGRSCFGEREACNDYSIGIELEGTDDRAYADDQYASLCGVLAALLGAYPGLDADRIVGHEHVAPGRKTDPGPAFDWERLRGQLGPRLAECVERGQSVGMAPEVGAGDGD